MKNASPHVSTIFLCLLSTNELLFAQTGAKEEVIVVATREQALIETQAPDISLLSQDQLQAVAAVHVQQSLSQVPGVSLQRGEGQESLPAIRSAVQTGAGACGSVLVLEDEVPVRGAGLCNVNELFDTHFEQAQRIEVVRGAGSAYYGSNALNGIVNVVLPKAETNRFSGELGPYGYRRAKLAFDSGLGQLLLTSSYDDGYRFDSGYTQHKVAWRHSGDWRGVRWQAGLSFTDLDQETAGFLVGEDAYLDRQLTRENPNPEAFRESRSLRGWVKAQWAINQKAELRTTAYARDAEMDFLLHFLPGDPLEENAQRAVGFQSALDLQLDDNLSLSIGLDGEFGEGMLRQSQSGETQGSPFLQETIPIGRHYDYLVDTQQVAAFSHLDWQLTSRLRIQAGLRWERMRYDYDNLMLTGRTRDNGTSCGFGGCRYSRPGDSIDQFNNVSPKLELSYKLSESLTLWLAAAESFRAPQATELYRLQREQTVAELNSVKAQSLEMGMRLQTNKTRLALIAYDTSTENVVIRDSDFFNINGQSVASRGVEGEIRHFFAGAWSTRLAASYASHRYTSDQELNGANIRDNLVDTAPRLTVNASLHWQPSPRLSTSLEAAHVDRYYLESNNRFEYPGHTLYHLRTSYRFNDYWQSSLRVLNLADRTYAERADYTNFTEQRYFPGLPRAVFWELQYQF